MQKKSSNTVEVKLYKLDHSLVMNVLKKYAIKALSKGAIVVILIGSLARGDYTAFSDADLIILVDSSKYEKLRPIDRIPHFLDPTLPIDVEPRVYTLNEMVKMALECRRVIEEIDRYGIILAGNDKAIREILEIYRMNCHKI